MPPKFRELFPCHLLLAAICLVMILPIHTDAALVLPRVFSDHAVLQKSARTPVWGTAVPGEMITIQLGSVSAQAKADGKGAWRAYLDLRQVGEGPFELTVTAPSGSQKLSDILVGQVWLCSGQSNMRYHLDRGTGGKEEAAAANDPKLRFLSVGLKVSATPVPDIKERWATCDPKTAADFSAVGYYVGKCLRESTKEPVGLIDASWAGCCIEAWMPTATLAADPDFQPILERWAKKAADYPARKAEFDQKKAELMAAWEQDAAKAKAEGKPEPEKPGPGPGNPDSLDLPSGLYNGMLLPLVPYGMRGVVWYQGEQNSGRGFQYRKLLPAMIADWRKIWDEGDFPFMIVQIPNVGKPETEPKSSVWAELREAQAMALKLPNTGMVVTIDVGEENQVHPSDKKSVGMRMGRLIEKQVYGLPVQGAVLGPTFKEMKVEGSDVHISYTDAAGLRTRDGQPPTDFAIAGADRKYVWAEAKILGETVVLHSDKVPAPVSARYDWADAPHGNLCNADGLPAAPFRTEDSQTASRNSR